MQKIVWTALTVLACLVAGGSTAPAPTDRISVIGAFRDQIEQFRRQMACGLNGGPPLAPFNAEYFALDFDEPPNIVSTGHASNITITGLDDFIISTLDFNLIRMRLDYVAFLPETRLTGAYAINATLLELFDLWGEGAFEFILTNAKVEGFMLINLVRGFLNLSQLDITLSLESIVSRLDGVMGDQETTDFYNEVIEQLGPWILEENRQAISEGLSAVLRPLINSVLNELTLGDLIGLSRGVGVARLTDGLECEFQ